MRNGLMALIAANKGRGQFHAQATGDNEATIWLYDVIVSDDYWGGVSALTLGKALAEHRNKSKIHLRINTPGGDVFAGRAMEQLIKESAVPVVGHIDGYAASAGSYVALACSETVINPGGMYMIHKGWTMGWGNADEMTRIAGLLNQIDETLIKTYADATGQDPEQIAKWLAAETWFSAQDAVKYGFVGSIAGADPGENDSTASASARIKPALWDLSAYSAGPRTGAEPARAELSDDFNARQAALYESFEQIAEEFGPFDQGTGAAGAHYVAAPQNPFAGQGLTCANCALYAGPHACEIVSGDIDPGAICKFWLIPERLIAANSTASNTFDRAAALRRLEAATL